MKKIFFLIALCSAYASKAEIGCMDNSKHGDTRDGYDYKNYYYTSCSCPCYRYPQSFKRGRCSRCLHYRSSSELNDQDLSLK